MIPSKNNMILQISGHSFMKDNQNCFSAEIICGKFRDILSDCIEINYTEENVQRNISSVLEKNFV